jgi:hypothetical protein
VVHRLKPKQDRSPRGIVAKFERRKDRNKVLSKAIAKLKNNKQFIVHEQYPIEIIDRRRQLVPIMKDARGKGHEAEIFDFTFCILNWIIIIRNTFEDEIIPH